ncbi:MAG: HAMP domain-containing protein [Acidobacteria bacterium]|nr:HAMP domain-containing protein [Acidobacteriota bacterium]MBI3423794.1 HAMP domain-containing protein [Acidobacteriota bacterium]
MPIRAKLVIVVFVFAILPMFLLWARWQGTAVGTITSMLRRDANNRAREISEQLDRAVQEQQTRLTELTQQAPLRIYANLLTQNNRTLPDSQLRLELSAFLLAHQQHYKTLLALNQTGEPVFKLDTQTNAYGIPQPLFASGDLAAEDKFNSLAAFLTTQTVHVSEIIEAPQGAYLWLLVPLQADDKTAPGALAAKVRVNPLLRDAAGPPGIQPRYSAQGETSASRPTGATWRESIILSPQGAVLYANDAALLGQPYAKAFPALQTPLAQMLDAGREDQQWDDWILRRRIHTTAPKLSIIILERYDQAIADLERNSAVMLLVTTLLATVAALTVYYLISNITNSIRRVTVGAKAIASGDLNHQIVVRTNDETRVLAHAFNRMAAKLREMLRKEGEQKQFESFARLSAVLTHDLKNQILSLSLLVKNMEKKFHREGFREDAMRTLSDTVENLTNLVAKLSDPRTPTKRVREQSDLTHLVERVLQRTAKQATGKYNITAKLTPSVMAIADGKAIERVIENLVINALEAMPDGGTLFILTGIEKGQALLSVGDTGKGMTEEFMRNRLFQPFATTKKKGIGLGLYSCREIIEQHGGRIDVNSQVDVGTEFRITLPLQAEQGKVAEKQVMTV